MSGNSSGGGCLLWMIDSSSARRRNKKIMKYNQNERGVDTYQSINVGSLLPVSTYQDSIIVSGGDQGERAGICEQLIRNAYNMSHPMIILHTANGQLENVIAGNRFGAIASDRSKVFDAFADFSLNEISQTVMDTCKSRYDIKPSGRYILQIVYDLLVSRGLPPYFSAYASCPYFKLYEQIENHFDARVMSRDDADRLNSLLLTGQAECPKIDTFFSDVKAQIAYLSAPDPKKVSVVSVLSAIKNNQVLCIDLRSSANAILIELVVNSLVAAMNRGYGFSLLIDDVALTNNDMLKNAVLQTTNHQKIIVSKDLYALAGGKEDVFNALIGGAVKTILFSHSSNVSCEKWSKYIGEYDKIDVSHNRNSGFHQSSRLGYNTNDGQTETMKREHRIKPEQINRLQRNEAIIYDHSTGSLIHTVIT